MGCDNFGGLGGALQRHLTRSVLFNHPEAAGRLMACVTHEAESCAQVFDLATGAVVQRLRRQVADKPYLAYATLGLNGSASADDNAPTKLLAALSDGSLEIFAWNSAGTGAD